MAAAAATSCVFLKIRSGKPTLTEISMVLQQSTACNMNCGIQGAVTTTYSLKATTAVIHLLTTRRRVLCATWEVVQQSSWFQQEHSVRTAGAWSMQDILLQISREAQALTSAAATCAGTRHRKSQLAEHHRTKHSSTLSKSTVDHCRV